MLFSRAPSRHWASRGPHRSRPFEMSGRRTGTYQALYCGEYSHTVVEKNHVITSSFSNASEMSTDDVTRPPVAGDQATDTDDKAVGVARYRRACERLQTTVSTGFLSQLGRRHVRLRDAKLSPAQLKAVCIALTTDHHVVSLDFSGSLIDTRGRNYICTLLITRPTISMLNMSRNKLGGKGIHEISKLISLTSCLQFLDLSDNGLQDEHSASICSIIQDGSTLRHLSLSRNKLMHEGGVRLADVLHDNEAIETLDLSWNHLRGKGAVCLAMGLQTNNTLMRLDLSWNGFGYDGCVALACMLRSNTSLLELNVESNRIHPPALFELVKGLVQNRTLELLKLGHNPITARVTVPFLRSIRDAPQMALVHVDLTAVVVDVDFESMLAEVRVTRPDFSVVYDTCLPIHVQRQREASDPRSVYNVNPVEILYHAKKNMRTIDLFNRIDRDGNARISRDEIRRMLEADHFTLSSTALDKLMAFLDVNSDGEIDLGEFLDGERTFKRIRIKAQQTQKEDRRRPEQQVGGSISKQ